DVQERIASLERAEKLRLEEAARAQAEREKAEREQVIKERVQRERPQGGRWGPNEGEQGRIEDVRPERDRTDATPDSGIATADNPLGSHLALLPPTEPIPTPSQQPDMLSNGTL